VKGVLAVLMARGRLDRYAIIVILSPDFWRGR
jgi:Trk-type K+ transport system membrane component